MEGLANRNGSRAGVSAGPATRGVIEWLCKQHQAMPRRVTSSLSCVDWRESPSQRPKQLRTFALELGSF
jgi:hypothetical protein